MTSNKIKLAYLISSLPKEGPVQVIYDIVENIDFSRFEVLIVTLKKEKKNSLFDKFKKLSIEIIQLKNSGKFKVLELRRQLRVILETNNIQILHSHCSKSLLLNWFSFDKVIKFHTLHIYPGFQLITINGYFVGNLLNFMTKQLIRKIDYPVSCSESLKGTLLQKDKIIVASVQNGVSPLLRPNISKIDLKRKLNLNPNINYFISIGRFSKEKNFSFLVDQFMCLNLKSYKLIILGDGILFNEISNLVDDSIVLLGFRENVSDYLFASDYYVSSSLAEGMPLSVLEAMSAGLPLLLSDIEPHKEILQKSEDKKIGLVYKSNDKIDFKLKIESILKMNYVDLYKNTISVYNEKFSAKKMSNEYQKLYNNAISKFQNLNLR